MTLLQDFIRRNNGKLMADPYGFYRGQCVSLCKQWIRKNHWPLVWGNAIQWSGRGDGKNYVFVHNTVELVPKAGWFAIFSAPYKEKQKDGTYKLVNYGHIGVVVKATDKTMDVFQQNDPLGSPAKIKTYNYVKPHCVGFLKKL